MKNQTNLGKFSSGHIDKYKLIVLEGPDGSGKSTLARLLSSSTNFHLYKTPPDLYKIDNIEDALVKDCRFYRARYLYYLSSMLYASAEVENELNNQHVICDRWIYSTQIYHNVILKKSFQHIDISDYLLSPDLIIVLGISEDIQKKRIKSRREQFDIIWENNSILQRQVREAYQKLTGYNIVHINNNGPIEKTLIECTEVINNYVCNR